MTEGHVYLPKNVLEVRTSRLLGVEIEGIENISWIFAWNERQL